MAPKKLIVARQAVGHEGQTLSAWAYEDAETGQPLGVLLDPEAFARSVACHLVEEAKTKQAAELERMQRTIKAHESTIALLKLENAELRGERADPRRSLGETPAG